MFSIGQTQLQGCPRCLIGILSTDSASARDWETWLLRAQNPGHPCHYSLIKQHRNGFPNRFSVGCAMAYLSRVCLHIDEMTISCNTINSKALQSPTGSLRHTAFLQTPRAQSQHQSRLILSSHLDHAEYYLHIRSSLPCTAVPTSSNLNLLRENMAANIGLRGELEIALCLEIRRVSNRKISAQPFSYLERRTTFKMNCTFLERHIKTFLTFLFLSIHAAVQRWDKWLVVFHCEAPAVLSSRDKCESLQRCFSSRLWSKESKDNTLLSWLRVFLDLHRLYWSG